MTLVLALSERDTAVMLLDCARMASIWTLEAAQHERRKTMEATARALPELWGRLDPAWHARDTEYVPERSKLMHYTAIHKQPWQPSPHRYAYQRHPVAQVWLDLARAADAAGYHVFCAARPSARYQTLFAQPRTACGREPKKKPPMRSEWGGETEGLQELIAAVGARTLLSYGDEARFFRSFSFHSSRYAPQTIETFDSNQHDLVTITYLGQALRPLRF